MRKIGLAAGLMLGVAACGGGEKAPAVDSTAVAPAPAASTETAPAASGATITVNMEYDGTTYKFVPNMINAKAGDKLVFVNVSGGPHNVQFFADSIPAGSKAALDAAMLGEKLDVLSGPLMNEPNQTYEISLAGLEAGDYKFTCTPHMAMNMNGHLIIK